MFELEAALIAANCVMEVEVNKLKLLSFFLKSLEGISCITAIYREKLVVNQEAQDFFSVLNDVGSDL